MTTGKQPPWLAALSAQYARKLPRQAGELQEVVKAVCRQSDSPEPKQQAYFLAHRLAGTAGTYGFEEVGRLARELELALADRVGSTLDGALLEQTADQLMVAAREAASSEASSGPTGDI